MCVAIYKPEGIATPSLEILEQCWDANPDGAGFAMRTNGDKYAIEIHKGHMTWKSFEKAFRQYHLADFKGDLFLHFRIATHGGISPGNTHPFSLTGDVKLLQHTHVKTNYALIHNGMLPIEPETPDISDTMEFCRRLAPLYLDIPAVLNLIEGMAGNNKIAIMTRETVHLLGEWESIDGVFYSNLLWDWAIDDFRSWREHSQLNQGRCPYCNGEVAQDDELFYCLDCGDVWQ